MLFWLEYASSPACDPFRSCGRSSHGWAEWTARAGAQGRSCGEARGKQQQQQQQQQRGGKRRKQRKQGRRERPASGVLSQFRSLAEVEGGAGHEMTVEECEEFARACLDTEFHECVGL